MGMGITDIISSLLSSFTSHYLISGLLVILGVIFYLVLVASQNYNDTGSGTSTPKDSTTTRRVSVIRETDENDTAVKAAESLRTSRGRMRKRDWAKKIYRSFMQQDSPGRSTPSDDSSDDKDKSKRKIKRRHSSAGPLQMARDLIGRGRYFRQHSELNREALPRPPMEFFEPADLPEIPQNLKPEIFYVLHNLKMLELPQQWRLDPKEIEVRDFAKDEYVVRPGDPDDSMWVPIEGCLAVYIACNEGKDSKEYLVKRITKGNAFFSLLSMLDILMSYPSMFKTVSLRATENSKVARFSVVSFVEHYRRDPQLWARPIQIVCTRLLHVTMTTLHQYMGLSSELMKPRLRDRPTTIEDHRIRNPSGQSFGQSQGHPSQAHQPHQPHQPQPFNQSFKAKDGTMVNRYRRMGSIADVDPADQMVIAKRWFAEALGIKDELDLMNELQLCHYEEGDILVEQGSEEEQLFLLLSGSILLKQDPVYDEEQEEDEEKWAAVVYPKEMIGGLQVLTNEPSFYTYKAGTAVTCAVLKKKQISELLEERPHVYLPIAHSVLNRLSPFVRGVDFALDWILLDSGQAAYRAGDAADCMYVVLSGRLRSVEKKTVIEEFGRGDVLGMVELLQKKPRSTTVLAVRFSQLARIPEGLLNFIKLTFPQVGFRLVQLLGHYYSSLFNRRAPLVPGSVRSIEQGAGDPMSHIKNLHTIAVVPASPEVPLVPFTCELYHALNANCRVLRLSSQKIAACLDPSVLEKQADFRLMHWLNVQEDTYPLVIYECDYTATNWTRRCLRQADAILVVGMGTRRPPKHSLLDEILSLNQEGLRTNKELILLWPEDTEVPSRTYEWLKGSYFSGHHHIRAPDRMFQWKNSGKENVPVYAPQVIEQEIIEFYEQNVFWDKLDLRCDFARLARILTGNAIGLVLGGGGARGASHVGVIRAMRELGIPVDIVGGTSIGSMIGGLFAETPDSTLEMRAKTWFDDMCNLWRKIWDLTYAHSAMFTGAGFNKTLSDLFGDREIEDLWIPYFCISTDISTSEMRVHRSGSLWTYARASMSLAGYLPPICDPQDGHHLLDGGYVNNLPADVMRSMGTRCVIAVDVGSVEETNLFNYGDTLSGWMLLLRRLNPWAEPLRILNMEEIQSRLAFVSCVRQLETVKKAPYCCYLRPPIEPFKTLDFAKFETILDCGYSYGRRMLEDLIINNDNLRAALGGHATQRFTRQHSRKEKRSLTSSFTDLAAALSKVPTVRRARHSFSTLDQLGADELEDLMLLDDSSEGEFGLSSDFNDASESEDEGALRLRTPRPTL